MSKDLFTPKTLLVPHLDKRGRQNGYVDVTVGEGVEQGLESVTGIRETRIRHAVEQQLVLSHRSAKQQQHIANAWKESEKRIKWKYYSNSTLRMPEKRVLQALMKVLQQQHITNAWKESITSINESNTATAHYECLKREYYKH